jgi:hypothetical protein
MVDTIDDEKVVRAGWLLSRTSSCLYGLVVKYGPK